MTDQTVGASPAGTPRPARGKRLAAIGLGVLALLVLLVLGALYFIKTGKVNQYIANQVVEALGEYGLRTEIGSFDLSWSTRKANVSGLKIYNQQTGQLIASVDQAEIAADIIEPFAFRLSREIVFKQLDLTNVNLYVETDDAGQSNLRGLHNAPPKAPSRITFDFSKLIVALRSGAVHVNDRPRKIQGDLKDLHANVQPLPDGQTVKGQLTTGVGDFRYRDRPVQIAGVELIGSGGPAGAQIERLSLRSTPVEATTSGRIDDWNTLRYNFDVQTRVTLAEIERIFEPGAAMTGVASFNGRIVGESERYDLTGDVTSDQLSASGANIRGVRVDGVSVKSDGGGKIQFTSKQLKAQAVEVKGARLADLTAGPVRGSYQNGRTQAELPQASVARVDLNEGQITGVTLTNLTATASDGAYNAQGRLDVQSGVIRGATLGPINGDLVADAQSVALNKFKANLFGGEALGDALIRTGGGGASTLNATFTGVKTADVFTLASNAKAPLAGALNGEVSLSWPGVDVLGATGSVTAHLAGETTGTADAIPLTGDVVVQAQSGVFNIDRFSLKTDVSEVTASGRLSPEGNSDLRIALRSTGAEQLQSIVYSFDEAKKLIDEYEPQVLGDLKFEGRVSGAIKDPSVEGDFEAASVSLHDEVIGALKGHVVLSPTEIRVDNGLLTATNGGTIKMTYAGPRDANATTGRLDATLDRIPVETLIAAGGLPTNQKFVEGEISGEANLTGLPASPQGKASINLGNGVIAGQRAELAVVNVVFDLNTARLERAEIRLPQGQLQADGTLDLKTFVFQVKGRADNIDLAGIAAAAEVSNLNLTGTANATFSATGNTKDIEQLNLELNAQGQNITINGRSAGELTLKAQTRQNGRLDVDLVTGIAGKPLPVRASVELRSPGRPATVEADLTQLDLGPVIAAFAPQYASTIAGSIDGKLRISGPTVNEKGEAIFDALKGNLSLTTIALELQGRPVKIDTPLTVSLNGPEVTLERTRISGEGIDLTLGGTLGFREKADLNFAVNGTADLETLGRAFTEYYVGGKAKIDVRLNGTFETPNLGGEITLENVAFSTLDMMLDLENGGGRILFSGNRIIFDRIGAQANGGDVYLTGGFTLENLRPKEWQVYLTAREALVFYQGAQIFLNADLTLAGNQREQTLNGFVYIPQAEYVTDFNLEQLTASGGELSIGGGRMFGRRSGIPPIKLDIGVDAFETLLIRNEQVNTVGSAALRITGLAREPYITGRISFEGGTIKFRSQRYDITAGTVDFPTGAGMSPVVNFLTEGDVSGYHVYVGLAGPMNDMDVTLRSEPDLPRSEVISLVTTGRTDSDSLGSQDLVRSGVGTAASLLTQEFISKPTESLLGLSRFQIDPVLRPNSNPAARLTIGRQLARDLSFTYSTNLGSEQDQTALTEYTLTNRFSGIASYTQGGTSTRGGSRDSDFTIEFRARKRFSLGFKQNDPLASNPLRAAAAAAASAPPRPVRGPLPKAEVELEKPEGVKLSDKRLRELLPVSKEGYSQPLARLGERNLTNYLQEHGYFFASVKSRCEPIDCSGSNLKLLYDVEAGQRYDLKDIRIEGTEQLNLGDVSPQLQSKTQSALGSVPYLKSLPFVGGLARGITSTDRLQQDRDIIRRAMVNLGYRSARVDPRFAFKPDSDDLIIIFDIEEGPKSTIADVMFRGNNILPYEKLRDAAPPKDNDPYSPAKNRAGTTNIKKLYADEGYLDATVELEVVDLPDQRVRLIYSINEGSRNIVSEVAITGFTKTKEESIQRFLAFKEGDTLTPDGIRRTQRDLYATGAFREVIVRSEPVSAGDESQRRINIGVTEAKPLLFIYGLGYSTDEGPRGLLQLSDTNMFGRVNSASIRLRASKREQLGQISYTDLRPYGTKWATTVSAFYNRNTRLQTIQREQLLPDGKVEKIDSQSYGINRLAAFIQTERKLTEKTSIRFRYSFERATLSNPQEIPPEEIGRNDRAIRLGLYSAGLTRDTRDSPLNSTRGQLVSAEYAIAAKIFGGNESYNRFFANYQRYYMFDRTTPVLRDTILAFSGRLGLASPFNVPATGTPDDKLLPISERFFAGGATTLRGFRFEQAGPQAVVRSPNNDPNAPVILPALIPIGGNAQAIMNFELRYPLTRQLRLVPFYDVGNVFPLVSNIRFRDLSNTLGVGLRFNTPIGPVGVDYGYLLNPASYCSNGLNVRNPQNSSECQGAGVLRLPQGVIHIRFGQSF